MESPDLRAPDCSGLDPRLAPVMAEQHAATVAKIAATAHDRDEAAQ
ncbi:Uncharacterised protein [Mycobacteroides abscessus subsp. massiliense]|nr:hypothetical protein [Mycobacteroides abscessus]SKT68300.1 Uncharacterised protein [Mycobacteroides abscessus subsp. massiliense]